MFRSRLGYTFTPATLVCVAKEMWKKIFSSFKNHKIIVNKWKSKILNFLIIIGSDTQKVYKFFMQV